MKLDISHSPQFKCKELAISFEADFKFTDALILEESNLVVLFTSGWSGELEFLGKVYNYSGEEIQVIYFPPNGTGGRQNAYWYSIEDSVGLRIYFHQQSERDFGGIYSITDNKYLSFHEAR